MPFQLIMSNLSLILAIIALFFLFVTLPHTDADGEGGLLNISGLSKRMFAKHLSYVLSASLDLLLFICELVETKALSPVSLWEVTSDETIRKMLHERL